MVCAWFELRKIVFFILSIKKHILPAWGNGSVLMQASLLFVQHDTEPAKREKNDTEIKAASFPEPLVFSNLSVFNILQWIYDVSNSQNNSFFLLECPRDKLKPYHCTAGLQDPAQLCCPSPFLAYSSSIWSQGDTNSPFIKKKNYFLCFISPEAASKESEDRKSVV